MDYLEEEFCAPSQIIAISMFLQLEVKFSYMGNFPGALPISSNLLTTALFSCK